MRRTHRVSRRRDPPCTFVVVAVLSGCASWSADIAPPRADRPWVPVTTAAGEILPGWAARPAAERRGGFVLPANAALAAVPDTVTAVEPDRAHTLAELIDVAQSNNPLTRVAWDTARNAALAVGIARSTYLPRLTAAVVGGYRQSSGSSTIDLGPATLNAGDTSSATGSVSALGLQWLIFDFGERAALVEAAGHVAIAANVGFTAAHQQLIYDVTLAYYTHATAILRVTLLEQSLANARAVQTAAEMRRRQGQGTVTDVAQARQATAQAELRLVQAQGRAQDTHQALVTAVGLSPMTRLRIADVSGRPLSPAAAAVTERMINEAVSRRPEVLAAYANAKAAEAGVDAARAEFLPKIFAAGNVAYIDGRLGLSSLPAVGDQGTSTLNLSGRQFGTVVIAGIAVPIYDGGVRRALLQQAQTRADSAQAVLRRTQQDSVRQIVSADNALRTGLAAHAAAVALEAAAETAFDATLAAYRNGVGSVTAATLAQNGLLDARLGRADTYSAVQIAAATLAFAMGSLGGAP
jgi:outer membrane protein TolC